MAKKRMKLATGGKRFAAYMIDAVPLWIITIALIVSSVHSTFNSVMNGFNYIYEDSYQYGTGGILNIIGKLFLYILIAGYVAAELFCISRAQTIGKLVMGLRVVDSKRGNPIGFGKMLFREIVVKQASQVVFYLGYIWILIDDQSRGWHDKILDTYVIDERLTARSEAMEAYMQQDYYSGYED